MRCSHHSVGESDYDSDHNRNRTELKVCLNNLNNVQSVICQITKVPKIDYKPGIKKLPMFHCERCKSQWEKYGNVSLQCANPNDIAVPITKEAAVFFEVGMKMIT